MDENVCFTGTRLRQETGNLDVSLKLKAIERKAVNWETRLEGILCCHHEPGCSAPIFGPLGSSRSRYRDDISIHPESRLLISLLVLKWN